MASSTRSVRHTFYIGAPAERVYRAFTEPSELNRWLTEHAEVTLRRGAPYRLVMVGGWEHKGTIAAVVPGKSITFRWAWNGVPLSGTRFRLSVEPSGSGSLLTVVHSGFPRRATWVPIYGVTEWGWTYYAMNLKSVLETGHDLRSPQDG